MFTRRQFLKSSSAIAALTLVSPATLASDLAAGLVTLEVRKQSADWFDDVQTAVWGYSQPTLRLKQGQPVTVRVNNRLDEPTTVHWHGVRVDNAMDGVPGFSQPVIQPGESFDYQLAPPDAGTFWFHSHHNALEQIARGLYGLLIVEPQAAEPEMEHDIPLLVDDWRIEQDGQLAGQYDNLHDMAHGGRMGNFLTVNRSRGAYEYRLRAGQRARVRLCNVANGRVFAFKCELPGGWLIAKDGQPLDEPRELPNQLVMAPGERWDMVFQVPQPGTTCRISALTRAEPLMIANFRLGESKGEVRPALTREDVRLPANPMPPAPVSASLAVSLPIEGGAMGRLRSARYEDQQMTMQQLVENSQVWALAGQVGLDDEPLLRVKRGQTFALDLVNDSAFAHAMHWHGHHAWVDGAWQDTILLERGERKQVLITAGSPGRWLIHCHMIGHTTAGMATWFEVS